MTSIPQVTPHRVLEPRRAARGHRAGMLALPLTALSWCCGLAAQDEGFQSNGLFSLPRSQDDIFEWKTARDEAKEGKFNEAVERLSALLASKRQGVVPVLEGVDRWLGQRAAVIATLRDLPPEGLAAYDRLTAREAGSLLRSAFRGNKHAELEALANGFPTSEAGRRARLRLGALALERGDVAAAVRHYLSALDATAAGHPDHQRTAQLLRLAHALAEGDRVANALDAGERAHLQRAKASLPDLAVDRGFFDHYGHARRPFTPPKGEPSLRARHAVEVFGSEGNEFAVHPVGGAFGIYVSDGERVRAIDPFARVPLWEGEGPFVRENENRNEYQGQFNRLSVLAPAVGNDVVVAALLVPSPGESARVRAFDVIVKIPVRRLVAFDRTTGKQVWTHYDTREGPLTRRFAGHLACGPPVIAGDTVYVASHDQTGSIAFYLAAYDLRTGEPRWRRLICSSQLEVNMFGNARFEFAASPLAIDGGVIYGTTNLGVCFAADQADGALRWVTGYEVTQMPQTRLTHQEERAVFFANNPVVVAAGVMACTPLDSEYVLGLDCATGRLLWRQHYMVRAGDESNHIQWLLGTIDDEFIVSGVGVLALKARPNRASLQASVRWIRSRESLGVDPIIDQPPRGAIVGDRIWYPRSAGISVFDKNGTTDPGASALLRAQPAGNLLVVDGLLISARQHAIDVHYDLDVLVQQADRRHRDQPGDPMAALELAQLLRAQAGENIEGSAAERAVEVLRGGLEAARAAGLPATNAVHRHLASQMFDLTLLRADSLKKRDRERALAQLRAARDGAPDDERWIEAQRKILAALPSPAEQIVEFRRIAERLGDRVVRFEPRREMPASAYALWQIAERESVAEQALQRWQELLERHPDVSLDGVAARDVASAIIAQIIARHGVAAYAPTEARAGQALASAAGDARALADVIEHFPHSVAAAGAVRSLMDLALAQGDFDAAARCYRHGRARADVQAGMQRRFLEAARQRGNLGFAAALAQRLIAEFGAVPSDLPGDAGKTYADAVRIEVPPAPPPASLPARPSHRVVELQPLMAGNRMQCVPVESARGFAAPPAIPCFVWEGGTVLRAHDPKLADAEHAAENTAPIYTLDCPRLNPHTPLLVCGQQLIVVEQDRVRGFRLDDGQHQWTRPAGEDRALLSVGVRAGLLHLFSEHVAAADGGRLLGIEPLTGTIVYERAFGPHDASLAPVAAGERLWSLRPEHDDPRRIWLEEIDPTSGQSIRRQGLSDEVRDLLGLRDDPVVHALLLRILHRLFVLDDSVVLASDGAADAPDRPPVVLALRSDGSVAWSWRGTPRRALVYLWHRDNVVAVYEAGMQAGGQLILFDARNRGRELQRIGELSGSVQALAAPRPQQLDHEGPRALALAVRNASGWSLVCRALGTGKPAFRARITADRELGNPVGLPVFGADFLLIAVNSLADGDTYLHTFDLESGREQRTRLPGTQVTRTMPLGSAIALETADGITILGTRGTPLR